MRKGIILAGGSGTRLYPLTSVACKQLLPVYDKPMFFYPLSTLLECGCAEIMVIVRNEVDQEAISDLIPYDMFDVTFTIAIQPRPIGLADAFRIADNYGFIGPEDRVMMILGDNLFHGDGLGEQIREIARGARRAHIFFQHVREASQYGVAVFNEDGSLRTIDEKPTHPASNWAQTGLYIYDHTVVQIAKDLKPSTRGELEITDVNNTYLRMGALEYTKLSRGCCWFDMGTPRDLLGAGEYVATLQERQGILVGCPALAALRAGLTDEERVARWAKSFQNEYGDSIREWLES